jgi:hypothetical protein
MAKKKKKKLHQINCQWQDYTTKLKRINVVVGNCNRFINLKWTFTIVNTTNVMWHHSSWKRIGYVYEHHFSNSSTPTIDKGTYILEI